MSDVRQFFCLVLLLITFFWFGRASSRNDSVFAPVYIDMTADTDHSPTANLCIAHLITSVGTQIHKAKIQLLSFSFKLLHLSYTKLVVPHLTSSALGCNLLSQYCQINPISTEFQYPLWLVLFLLLALTHLGLYVFSSFSMLQQLHRS